MKPQTMDLTPTCAGLVMICSLILESPGVSIAGKQLAKKELLKLARRVEESN